MWRWEQATPEKNPQVAASPTVGWTTVKGDQKKFQELYWQPEGWNGGLEGVWADQLAEPGLENHRRRPCAVE